MSAGLIFVAAPILARSADRLAELTGLGQHFFWDGLPAIFHDAP